MKTILLAYFSLGSFALALGADATTTQATPRFRDAPILSTVVAVSPKTNHLGQGLTVTVTDLNTLLTNAYVYQKDILLFVDGKELTGVVPIGMDLGSNTLRFILKRTPENKDVWTPLLLDPIPQPIRPISFSVGLKGDSPLLVDPKARNSWLYVIGWNWWTILWLIVFAILICVFLLLAVFSDILRTPVADSDGRRPYSLSRTQAAVWLFVTALSFVFILVITGDLATLNASVLALIGISSGTFVASSILEKPSVDEAKRFANQAARAQVPAVNQPAPGNPPPPANPVPAAPVPIAPTPVAPAANEPLIPIGATVVSKARIIARRIENIPFFGRFLGDILSDDDGGVSVPRFQIFVWTIVLGIIFMGAVVKELSMPEFNATLLALMGISSATYVGAKLTR